MPKIYNARDVKLAVHGVIIKEGTTRVTYSLEDFETAKEEAFKFVHPASWSGSQDFGKVIDVEGEDITRPRLGGGE